MSETARSHMRIVASTPAPAHAAGTEVVLQAQAGDRAAFRSLYDAHVDAVAGLCIRMMRNRERGLDAAQETFTTAFQKLNALSDPATFNAWCMQIAVNVCRMAMRKEKWLRYVGIGDDDFDSVPTPSAHLNDITEARIDLAQVLGVVRHLPNDQRIAWNLKHIEQESLVQIAALTGRSLASTKRDIDAAEHEVQRKLGGTP